MSRSRLCTDCGQRELESNIRQMEARSGPNFAKWRDGMIRAAGGQFRHSHSSTR